MGTDLMTKDANLPALESFLAGTAQGSIASHHAETESLRGLNIVTTQNAWLTVLAAHLGIKSTPSNAYLFVETGSLSGLKFVMMEDMGITEDATQLVEVTCLDLPVLELLA